MITREENTISIMQRNDAKLSAFGGESTVKSRNEIGDGLMMSDRKISFTHEGIRSTRGGMMDYINLN